MPAAKTALRLQRRMARQRARVAVAAIALLAGRASARASHNPDSVKLYVRNEADVPLDIAWINTFSKNALVKQREKPIAPYSSMNIDSYFSHSFLLSDEELEIDTYTESMHDPSTMVKFTMSEYDEEVVVGRADNGTLTMKKMNSLTRTMDLMDEARKKCMPVCTAKTCPNEGSVAATPEFLTCVGNEVAKKHANVERDLSRTLKLLEEVGDRARNYTCIDPNMTTTNDTVRTFKWNSEDYRPPGKPKFVPVKVFLDEPSAKIMLLDDFVTDEECVQLQERATKSGMAAASVNSDDGGSILSPARRAKAGAVDPDLEDPADPITALFLRSYAFADAQTGYGIPVEGQEGFSVIKYDATDEYRPHCDGDCTGVAFKPGGRVATMVVYCEQAKAGGGTTFSSADVFLNGKRGQAAFFSYYDKAKNITDVGLTRHSGCPVLDGNKWIATMWMRLGVGADKHWTLFDPEGNIVSEMQKRSRKSKGSSGDSDDDEESEEEQEEEEEEESGVEEEL